MESPNSYKKYPIKKAKPRDMPVVHIYIILRKYTYTGVQIQRGIIKEIISHDI